MTGFHEIRFPMRLALGAVGGPQWQTDVIQLASGREVRNAKWARSRRRWTVGGALTDLASLQALVSFFEARSGQLYGFRFRDPLDGSSAPAGQDVHFEDQIIGYGDGSAQAFQLVKTTAGKERAIVKPVPASVHVGLDGTALQDGWAVDETTGLVTFDTPPAAGSLLTAGFEFDCPVRFDSDQIEAVIEAFGAGCVAAIGLVELSPSDA